MVGAANMATLVWAAMASSTRSGSKEPGRMTLCEPRAM